MKGSPDPSIPWPLLYVQNSHTLKLHSFLSNSFSLYSFLFISSSPFHLPHPIIVNFLFFSKWTTKGKRRGKRKGEELINKKEEGDEEFERKGIENLVRKTKMNKKKNKFVY